MAAVGDPDATTDPPRELPVVGGDLALDLANTVDDPEGPARHDHLDTYGHLLAWAARVGAVDPGSVPRLTDAAGRDPVGAASALREAHALRDALNEVFGAVVEHPERAVAEVAGWTVVRELTARAVARGDLVRPEPAAALTWSWSVDHDLLAPLHPVAVAATDLLLSSRLDRVKRCGRCPWLFVDTTRNRSRRWCDMDDCGRAEKIERYVARRAARRRSSSS